MIELGDKAKDTMTGFKGIVIAITDWLHGCKRITIQPTELHEGKPIDALSFDEPQVIVTKKMNKPKSEPRFGPKSEPTRNSI